MPFSHGSGGDSAIVPAIAGAIDAATGRRLREVPVDASLLAGVTTSFIEGFRDDS
jgi:CO/xanthine dehydrogenase Mo-binding subunit